MARVNHAVRIPRGTSRLVVHVIHVTGGNAMRAENITSR